MKSGALQIYFQFFVSCCSYVSCLGQVYGWSSLPFTANSFETTFIVDVVVDKAAFEFEKNYQVVSKFTWILSRCSLFTWVGLSRCMGEFGALSIHHQFIWNNLYCRRRRGEGSFCILSKSSGHLKVYFHLALLLFIYISCVRRWVHIDIEDWRDVTIFRWRIKFIGVSWTWFQFSCIFEAEPWHAWSRNVWKSAFQTQFSQQIRYQWRHWKSWWILHVWLICIWTLLSSWLWNLWLQISKFGPASPYTSMVMIFLLWFPVISLVCTTKIQNLVYTTLVFSEYCDLHENCNFHLLSTLSTTRIFQYRLIQHDTLKVDNLSRKAPNKYLQKRFA